MGVKYIPNKNFDYFGVVTVCNYRKALQQMCSSCGHGVAKSPSLCTMHTHCCTDAVQYEQRQ